MTTPTPDALLQLLKSGRGTRPWSYQSPEAEEVLNVALALLVELSASNERIDRLERMVAELRHEPLSALREVAYESGAPAEERKEAMEALFLRCLHLFFDSRTFAGASPQ